LRAGRPIGTVRPMSAAGEPRRLALEVRFDRQPIQGRLYYDEGGRVDRPFSGWLGLMSAIDAARGADQDSPRDRNGERT
jgi:hypothetical protein